MVVRPRIGWGALTLLMVIIAIGSVLRFWDLSAQSLWFDEGYSAWVVRLSPWQIIEVIRNDVSPPLYYLLLKLWTGAFGDSEAALRSMSAVAAVASLLLVLAIAWRITRNATATLVAAGAYAVSVLQIQFAQEARSYGLASLLAAVSLYAAVRRLQGRSGWLWLLWLSCLASVYLHNMMWFYVASLCFAYVVMPGAVPLKRRTVELVLLGLAMAAGYAVWVPALLGQMAWLKGNFWASVPTWDALATVLVAVSGMKRMHLGGITEHAGWFAGAVAAGLCAAAMMGRSRQQVRYAVALLGYGLLPVLAVFIHAQVGQSYFLEKIFTASTLILPLLVGLTVTGRTRMVAWPLLVVLLAGSGISVYGQLFHEPKEQWREAVAYVNSFERESTLVVFVANEGELLYDYYTQRTGAMAHDTAGVPQGFLELQPPRTIQRVKDQRDIQRLGEILDQRRPARVLLVYSHWQYSDPEELTRHMLDGRMRETSRKSFHLVDVLEYQPRYTHRPLAARLRPWTRESQHSGKLVLHHRCGSLPAGARAWPVL